MNDLLERYRIVGAALALAKEGRIALARGYGYADPELKEPVLPEALFCIGSITKPITAAAILKLVDDGKLDLESRLVNVLDDLGPLPGQAIADPRFREITVYHLLYHAGGFPQDNHPAQDEGPPPAKALARREGIRGPLTPELLYRVALGEPLAFTPGTESRYSNLGFVVLRLVVEHASGQPYEAYAQEHVLQPMGITRMRLEPRGPHYVPGEVRRYARGGRPVLPGGINPRVNAAGNWLASAVDLVKFLTAIDESRGRPFLSPRTTQLMFDPPPPPYQSPHPDRYFGLGWDSVRKTRGAWSSLKAGPRRGAGPSSITCPTASTGPSFSTRPRRNPTTRPR
jgi:N-acyl-D-amino-acid deacylase